jgi:hypothetical protein
MQFLYCIYPHANQTRAPANFGSFSKNVRYRNNLQPNTRSEKGFR